MKRNLKIIFIIIGLFILTYKPAIAESLQDLANELNDIREEITNLKTPELTGPILPIIGGNKKAVIGKVLKHDASTNTVTYLELGPGSRIKHGKVLGEGNLVDIAKKQQLEAAAEQATEQIRSQNAIDNALKHIDEATKFMQESYAKGDIDGAIASLALVEVTLDDISRNVPHQFRSEVLEESKKFSEEEMAKISSITKNITNDKKKEEAFVELKKNIELVNDKGLDVEKITKTIIQSGLQTPKLENYFNQASKNFLKDNLTDAVKYSSIIGKSPEEVNTAIKQLEAITSGDPKKLRAFEIEKYGKAAGLSQDVIKQGINAVYNGDIKLEKKISKSIIDKLSSNTSISDTQFNSMMDEQFAAEKAAYKILNSNIKIGFSGTKQSDVDNLANEIEKILDGKVDKNKIEKIKTEITNRSISPWSSIGSASKEQLAASLIANINGKEYVNALQQATIGATSDLFSKSVAAQAAAVEASLKGNLDEFSKVDLSSNKDILSNMSLEEVNQLREVLKDTVSQEANKATQVVNELRFQKEYQKHLKQQIINKNYEMADIPIGTDFEKSNELYWEISDLQVKSMGLVEYDKIPKDFIESVNKLEASTKEALKKATLATDATTLATQSTSLVEQATNEATKEASEAAAAEASKEAAEQAAEQAAQQAQQAAEQAAATAASDASDAAKQAAADAAQQAAEAAEVAQQAAADAAKEAAQEAAEAATAQAQEVAQQAAAEVASEAAVQAQEAASEAATEASELVAESIKDDVKNDVLDKISDLQNQMDEIEANIDKSDWSGVWGNKEFMHMWIEKGDYESYERMKREMGHIYDAETIETYNPDSPTFYKKN
jgi:hypothetical protein